MRICPATTNSTCSTCSTRGTKFALAASLVFFALSGCTGAPYVAPTSQPSTTVPARGNADALVELARSGSEQEAPSLWLAAAEALYTESRTADANGALANVSPDLLSETEAFNFGALSTQLALERFDGPAAKAFYANLLPLNPQQDLRFQALAQQLQALNIDPVAAASALINQPMPRGRSARAQRTDQIWALVSQSPAAEVTRQANTTGGVEQGWWQLKESLLGAFTMAEATQRLSRWQSANAQHPASQAPPTQLTAIQNGRKEFNHIALLVPQSGPLAAAGKAVRDGFVAAHLHAAQSAAGKTRTSSLNGDQQRIGPPQITVLDTASAQLPELLNQARALGADLLVGPLDKNRTAQLNAQSDRASAEQRIPTLLLNYLPDDTAASSNIVQFGLAVEDEARAIARRIQAEGLERVIVLHNTKEWSERARDALIAEFTNASLTPEASMNVANSGLGQTVSPVFSKVVGIGSTPDVKQVTSVVGNTLLVDESSARHRSLEQTLGEDIEFVPRARQDVDAIVAFLDGPEARALRPALRFHFSSRVPVYTSSQALRRIASRDLRDLRGFNVSEIPWKLYPSEIKSSVESSFGVTQGGLVPLYALGVDAYRLADRLDILLNTPHQRLLGGTGELSIGYNGRVRRDLAWQYVGPDGLIPLPMVMTGASAESGETSPPFGASSSNGASMR